MATVVACLTITLMSACNSSNNKKVEAESPSKAAIELYDITDNQIRVYDGTYDVGET